MQRRTNIDAPLVIGEHFAAEGNAAIERLDEMYDRGYAGAWAWSLLPEFTNDKMAVDLDALQEFGASHDDIGP